MEGATERRNSGTSQNSENSENSRNLRSSGQRANQSLQTPVRTPADRFRDPVTIVRRESAMARNVTETRAGEETDETPVPGTARQGARISPVPFMQQENNNREDEMDDGADSVPTSIEKFEDIIQKTTKLSVTLKGSANYTDWESVLLRALDKIRCAGVLTGTAKARVSRAMWKAMSAGVEELILSSIPTSDRIELNRADASEMIMILRSRYAKYGPAQCGSTMATLLKLKQAGMSVGEYISKFEKLKSACVVAGVEMGPTAWVPMMLEGMHDLYNEKGHEELGRQKEDLDVESVKAALIRAEEFEKAHRRRPQHQQQYQQQHQQQHQQGGANQRGSFRGGAERGSSRGFRGAFRGGPPRGGFGAGRGTGNASAVTAGPDQANQQQGTNQQGALVRLCTYCGMTGHMEQYCFRRVGYPEGWFDRNRGNGGDANQGGGSAAFSVMVQGGKEGWLLDSGATLHITDEEQVLSHVESAHEDLRLANGEHVVAVSKGTANIAGMEIQGVHFVPGIKMNIISVPRLAETGRVVIFDKGGAWIKGLNGTTRHYPTAEKGLYYLSAKIGAFGGSGGVPSEPRPEAEEEKEKDVAPKRICKDLLHARFGHINKEYLRAIPNAVADLIVLAPGKKTFCEPCVLGRQRRRPNRTMQVMRATKVGQKLHMDLCGGGYTFASRETQEGEGFSELPASQGGAKLFLVITDDYSRWRSVVPMKKKSDTVDEVMKYVIELKTKGMAVEAVRCDGGGEFVNERLSKWLGWNGIKMEKSSPYTPEQNGMAEKSVDMVCTKARTMMLAAGLPEKMWAEAVVTAAYIINRIPTKTTNGKTPFELFNGYAPTIMHMRVFGCAAYTHVPKAKQGGKMAARSRKLYLVGYDSTNVYRVWDPDTGNVMCRRDVVFNEEDLFNKKKEKDVVLSESEGSDGGVPVEDNGLADMAQKAMDLMGPDILPSNGPVVSVVKKVLRKKAKKGKNPAWPITYKDAEKSPQASKWKEAMDVQIKALKDNNTWQEIPKKSVPKEAQVLSGRWVYSEKEENEEGAKLQKARWVVRGFEERDTWEDLTAATVKAQTTRILFGLAAAQDWELEQMDAVAAFLNGDIEGDVYVDMPTGFGRPSVVCKLNKALYGLKASPAIWYETQSEFLITLGFDQSTRDPALFIRHRQGKGSVYVTSHVDDYIVTGGDKEGVWQTKKDISMKFKMKDLGACKAYLGMEVVRDRPNRAIKMNQTAYATKLVTDAGMWNARTVSTPMEASTVVEPADVPIKMEEFRSLLGKIQWLAVVTRPDITHTAGMLGSVATKPSEQAWNALKHLLRYIRGSLDVGLEFGRREGGESLMGYSDANWADGDAAKSTTGTVFLLNGGPVHWYSKRQSIVALSTCEAEYVALAVATQDAAWLGPHLDEILNREEKCVAVGVDNQGAIALAKRDGWNRRTRHMNVRYQFVQQAQRERKIDTVYVETGKQHADGLTKSLKRELFERWRGQLCV
jgi:Reverse transcriptase (RNA-dependent DNA polymerase)